MKENKKKVAIIVVVILLITGVVIGVSYAWWTSTAVQESVNKITSDCLELKIVEDKNEINLTSAYPVRDSEIGNLIPYEFTVQNTCNLDVEYNVYLEILKNELASQYIDVSLNNESKRVLESLEENKEPLLKETVEARTLAKKKRLNAKESVTYKLKLWIDESVTLEDNIQNKNFEGKVVIDGSIAEPENP